MGNIYGTLFKITTFGESHGPAIGVTIEGCPPKLPLDPSEIQLELDRRRPGQSKLTSNRNETDTVEILSGLFQGQTTGTPLTMLIRNKDAKPEEYDAIKNAYRPSHADFTYEGKYGIQDHRGSGRASARETAARVAAGAVAKKILKMECGMELVAYVESIYNVSMGPISEIPTREAIENSPVRCPDPEATERMITCIENAKKAGDSVGGKIVLKGYNINRILFLGSPVFDRLEADLAKAMLSIPATKGFEMGSGFAASEMLGSEHNDTISTDPDGEVVFESNNAGGTLGGISNGAPLVFRTAFKPPATIAQKQQTITREGRETTELEVKGRHDPCVLPRAVPIVEAMTALTLVDHLMRDRAQNRGFSFQEDTLCTHI